jgi:hypothetical protein
LWSKYLLPFTWTIRSLETSEETDLHCEIKLLTSFLQDIRHMTLSAAYWMIYKFFTWQPEQCRTCPAGIRVSWTSWLILLIFFLIMCSSNCFLNIVESDRPDFFTSSPTYASHSMHEKPQKVPSSAASERWSQKKTELNKTTCFLYKVSLLLRKPASCYSRQSKPLIFINSRREREREREREQIEILGGEEIC